MKLSFQIRREDFLALNRAYLEGSPTHRRARTGARFMLPVMMLCIWLFTLAHSGIDTTFTLFCTVGSALWFFLYPARFDRSVQRYAERMIDEASYAKVFGPCELVLSESGLHSRANAGESTFPWSSVSSVVLTESHLVILLAGPMGYAVPIADIGQETAKAAYEQALAASQRTGQ